MKTHLITRALAVLSLMIPLAASAQDLPPSVQNWEDDRTQVFDAEGLDLAEFVWLARPLVVFADSPFDPQFQEQMDLIRARIADLAIRDVIVITDTNPAEPGSLRRQLRPRGFMMALVGKDGHVALRKPAPWDVRELSRSIDKMPMRQQEIRDRRGSTGTGG